MTDTQTEPTELEAGEELDHSVATLIMRWERFDGGMGWGVPAQGGYAWQANVLTWNPSTRFDHAWQVVEALRKMGWRHSFHERGPWWEVMAFKGMAQSVRTEGGSLPLAICRAAMKTLARP